jgi:hypothetical protein
MNSDFLMRSLGRPNRDQIVSSRPNDLTTLEAIDLAAGETLSDWLNAGARRWAERQRSTAQLIDDLYLTALSRRPTAAERAVLVDELGDQPDPRAIADAIWAVVMTPEFLMVR